MCRYATLVMRPIRELVEQEARTMASLLSEVPGELGVEEALVGMVMAIEREKGRKGAEEMEESVEERKEGAKVEEAPA